MDNYIKFIDGKNVIIIGPAGYYNEPDTLDCEVVVRINRGYIRRRRTEVLYSNNRQFKPTHLDTTKQMIKELGIKWVIAKREDKRLKLNNLLYLPATLTYEIRDRMAKLGGTTAPNMGLLAVEHLLLTTRLKTLTIRGFDLYESGYIKNYWHECPAGCDKESIARIKDVTRGHDQEIHRRYYKEHVLKDSRVDIDGRFWGVLNEANS